MSTVLYDFIPTASLALVALLLLYRIHRRSVSTFVSVSGISVALNLAHYGYLDAAAGVALLTMILLVYRAMLRPPTDHLWRMS